MFGPTGMLVGPDLVPRVAQTKSEAPACKSSLVEDRPCQASVDSEKCAQSQDESSPTSSELSAQAAPRVPFLDDMMTQTNMLVLPPSNPSYQMAYFLKTTGPVAELPSKPARGKRISLAMRLFKSSNRRPSENLSTAQKRTDYALPEEAVSEILAPTMAPRLPDGVVQKISRTGKRYLQIEPTIEAQPMMTKVLPSAPLIAPSPNILESRVSVFLDEQVSTEDLNNWILAIEGHAREDDDLERWRLPANKKIPADRTVRMLDVNDSTPVRSTASVLAMPTLDSGVDVMATDRDGSQKIAALRSHPPTTSGSQGRLPQSPLQDHVSDRPGAPRMAQLAHPSPRRLGSHSLLLKRSTSDATKLGWSAQDDAAIETSVSDEPGPRQSRSPIKIHKRTQPVEKVLVGRSGWSEPRKQGKGQAGPEDQLKSDQTEVEALPQFQTRGTKSTAWDLGPVSRGTSLASDEIFDSTKIRHEYAKDRNVPLTTLDTVMKPAQAETSRHRLRRARPEGPRPHDVSRKLPGTSGGDRRGSSDVGTLPTKRPLSGSTSSDRVRIAPKALASSLKIGYYRRPTNAFLRGKNSPAARPRSAKMARSQARSTHSGSRPSSPIEVLERTKPVVLPGGTSQTPGFAKAVERGNRTPQSSRSGISIDAALARANSTKVLPPPPIYAQGHSFEFPSPPSCTVSPRRELPPINNDESSPISIRAAGLPERAKKENIESHLEARIEAIERRNRLLEAALMAVLKTSGTLNGCPCSLDSQSCSEHSELGQGHHKAQCSIGSGFSSEVGGRDVLQVFKETKVRY